MGRETILLRRVRVFAGLFIIGLILSGVTAIPLRQEVTLLVDFTGKNSSLMGLNQWLSTVQAALDDTRAHHPFLFYGTDWLAFGHFVIAIAFIGAFRDPVRNRWLFGFGLIACALVIPYALVFGQLRGIPWWWRCIDCSFGVFGSIPLWLCRRWTIELEKSDRDFH
ncbi:MAG TPA: hypothetical protein VGN23_03655 [Verrucomicrobiae bacterium]|jgi:hypothetical protein